MERVQVGITVERHVYQALVARAATMNMKPADFAGRLFHAAWSARGGQEAGIQAADMDLGLQIRLVFALSGDGDIPGIARATKLPELLVRDILHGFRQVAEERREALLRGSGDAGAPQDEGAGAVAVAAGGEAPPPSRALPEPPPPPAGVAEGSDAVAPEPKRRAGSYTDEEIETVRSMWAAGAEGKAIAAAIGRSAGALSVWVSKNRDVCPRRRA